MKKHMFLTAISCPALLACSTAGTEPNIPERGVTLGYMCNAAELESFVGQQATDAIGADALKKSGAKKLRWIPPYTPVTMDFRQDRLNIEYDEKMVITRIRCG
tara:strand:+ start:1586 stop:1894 length:309 start_codon:yes stop_codon:yes gene_type:complete